MLTRSDKILSCIEPSTQLGIEIGPLTSPIVTRDMGMIRYVDYATAEELKTKYADEAGVDTSKIVEVDYIWGAQSLPDLVGNEAPFDYAIASHVIEHVPDLIGWLKELHAILKPGGMLSLAIPDKRFCFDYRRDLTKPADILEAYLLRSRKPSPRQVFDHLASAVARQGAIAWSGEVDEHELVNIHTEAEAWKITHQAFLDDTYRDTHCWVFTPASFFKLLETLIHLNLFDFKVIKLYETEGYEFYVSLEALDSQPSARVETQLESLPHLAAVLPLPNLDLTVLEVSKPMDSSPLVLNYAIDSLKVGQKISSAAVEIRGWLIGRNSKAITIQVIYRDQILQMIPVEQSRLDVAKVYPGIPGAERSGFVGTIAATKLSGTFDLSLQAIFEDGSSRLFSIIKFQRLVQTAPSYL